MHFLSVGQPVAESILAGIGLDLAGKKKDVQELDVRINNTYGGLKHYAAFRSSTETSGLPVLSETIFTDARGWVTDA